MGDESLPVQEEANEHMTAACDSAIETQSANDPKWSANPHAGQQHEDNMTYHEVYQPPFKCEWCDCRFETMPDCSRHMNAENNHSLWPCKKCHSVFLPDQHVEHMTVKHDYLEPFECKTGDVAFLIQDERDQHIDAEDHYVEPYECETCPKAFRTQDERDQHMKAEDHYRETFKCETCPKVFHTQDLRDKHQSSEGHYHRLYCADCDRYYSAPEAVQQHRKSERHKRQCQADYQDDRVPCPRCSDTFSNAWRLARHIELSVCPWGSGLTREKIWQYYRKCDPQGVFTEPPDSQYNKEQGDTALTWNGPSAWNGDAYECYICHTLFISNYKLQEHMIMKYVGQEEMYHCPKRARCLRGTKPFGSLQAFLRHLEGDGCASLNLHTVLCTVTGSDWPQDTAKNHMVGQVLDCLKS